MRSRLAFTSCVWLVVVGCSSGDAATPADAATPVDAAGLGTDVCAPTTCQALGFDCGDVDDGCGLTLDCGTCVAPTTCGGGGTDNVCGCSPQCNGAVCGEDGCGGYCGGGDGTCAGAQDVCTSGTCVCVPDCDGKACGDDGCGDTCGDCDGSTPLCLAAQCEPYAAAWAGTWRGTFTVNINEPFFRGCSTPVTFDVNPTGMPHFVVSCLGSAGGAPATLVLAVLDIGADGAATGSYFQILNGSAGGGQTVSGQFSSGPPDTLSMVMSASPGATLTATRDP